MTEETKIPDIVGVKLKDGTDLLGILYANTNDALHLNDVMGLRNNFILDQETGYSSKVITPFLYYTQNLNATVVIDKKDILFYSFADSYSMLYYHTNINHLLENEIDARNEVLSLLKPLEEEEAPQVDNLKKDSLVLNEFGMPTYIEDDPEENYIKTGNPNKMITIH